VCCPTGRSMLISINGACEKAMQDCRRSNQNRPVRVELKPATFPFPRPSAGSKSRSAAVACHIVMCYRYFRGPAPQAGDGSGHAQGPDLGGADWVFRGCQKPRDECRWQAGRSFYGISYTTSSSAIPRSDARCRTGSRLLVLRIHEEPGCSTTGPVAKIEREAARP
jgi:hypothetical protein